MSVHEVILRINYDALLCSAVIKKAVRGKGAFPPDFRRWLFAQLAEEYTAEEQGSQDSGLRVEKKHSSVSSTIETLQGVIQQSGDNFSELTQADYKRTISAWRQLSLSAASLQGAYADEKREVEEARKRREEEEAQKRREEEEAQKRREEE